MGTGKNRRQRLLDEYPNCYLCGGINRATSVDHVPPRACFPRGYAPEGFEFPACDACNQSTRADDQVFGFWAMVLDFDPAKVTNLLDRQRITQLMKQVSVESRDELLAVANGRPIHQIGSIITPSPSAYCAPMPRSFKRSARSISVKLTHALYFRETTRFLTSHHSFCTTTYQPQLPGGQEWTRFFLSLLPETSIGTRRNIPGYGDRFAYRSGYKPEEDFFCYLAQFGRGLMLWGIVCGPGVERPSSGPLSSLTWQNGASGAGANSDPGIGRD